MMPPALTIGSVSVDPPLFGAPMAGFTNYAFRQMLRDFGGVGLPATEMVSARGFLEIDRRDARFPDRLRGVRDEPRPLAVQIWDNDPAKLAAVAHRLATEFQVSVIDLNFGCPARDIAEKAESGAYLLDFPEKIEQIVGEVARAAETVPVTAKIRLGTTRDRITAGEVAEAVEAAGGAALTVHGRTAADKYRGTADWDRIADVKSHLRAIPLIGNGDLRSAEDVVDAFQAYPVDGVMIGRAALGRPWLFSQAVEALAGRDVPTEPNLEKRRELLERHYRLIVADFGEARGTVLMRRYACSYSTGLPGARRFRERVSHASTEDEFRAALDEVFPS